MSVLYCRENAVGFLAILAVYALTDTNWLKISSFETAADNDVWYDPEPASMQSKFYRVKSQP